MSEFFKKAFAVFIAIFTAISSFITGAINIQKHDLAIKLSSNPSTGCSWLVEIDNEDVVIDCGSKYVADPTRPNVAGAGGHETFYFDAAADGEAAITLTYGQHWDGGSIFRTVVYKVTVTDGKLEVTDIIDSAEKAA